MKTSVSSLHFILHPSAFILLLNNGSKRRCFFYPIDSNRYETVARGIFGQIYLDIIIGDCPRSTMQKQRISLLSDEALPVPNIFLRSQAAQFCSAFRNLLMT